MLDVRGKCLCGSGLQYGDCCKKKPLLGDKKTMSVLAEARKHHNQFRVPCIMPDNQGNICGNKSIRSHNMQENGILSKLSEKGHVYVIGDEATVENYELVLKPSGINRTTIFKCLCNEHDRELFGEIEKELYTGNKKQIYQFALKVALNAYWKQLSAQDLLRQWAKNNNIFAHELLVEHFIQTEVDLARTKHDFERFANLLFSENYDEIQSIKLSLDYEVQFAASVPLHFAFDLTGKNKIVGNDAFARDGNGLKLEGASSCPTVYTTVFPQEGQTHIMLSWFKEDYQSLQKVINQLAIRSPKGQLMILNFLLPVVCENLVFSPRLIDNLSAQGKKELVTLFRPEALSMYNGDDFDGKTGCDITSLCQGVHYDIFEDLSNKKFQ